jgi:hypothetical protein
MDGFLSKKPNLYFVDDPGKLYSQRRRATQAKGLETLDPKAEAEGSSKSPRESPPPSPKEATATHGRTTATGMQDRAMYPGHCRSTYHKPLRRLKAVQDQGLNYLHGETLAFHR